MVLQKTFPKFVALLAMLIVSSSSVPIVEDGSAATTEIPETIEAKMIRYRLPNDVIPHFYKIQIEPNMDSEDFTWNGKTSIDIQVTNPTPKLTLHASKNLVIDEKFTNLIAADNSKFKLVQHNREDELEFLSLQFENDIPIGNYSLGLKFEGSSDAIIGFYRSQHKSGETLRAAGTHFEATTARRAFPCWDEPALKAGFRMSIKHFPNYTAVSNMPEIEHVETPDGKILTTFDTTPIMSTYLLTFVIANYENVFNEHRNVSLHSPKRVLEDVRNLIEFSPKVVKVMEAYTGLPFGFPRIGSVLLPIYSAAATEHWGLVTYNEMAITFDPTSDKTSTKDAVDMLIAHELSHSWFGNRVTPLWWNDLWLNEAFAAYFQYYIMDEIYDNWHGVELFIVRNNQELAYIVSSEDYSPITLPVVTTKEIRLVFGPGTYRKGSAVVHMFRNVLGDSVFRTGLQQFMTKHSFKSAVADDLTAAFQEAYNEGPNKDKPLNVKETMTSWLVQKGYPIITVSRNYTTGETAVTQKSSIESENSTKWWIPLTYATKSNPNFASTLPASWISDKEDSVTIDGIAKDDWVVMNIQASGFYRINYDEENWNRIADYLNSDNYQNIHPLNRAQLIDDAYNFVTLWEPNWYLRNFYKLTKYLARETEYLPWRSVTQAIYRIDYQLSKTSVHRIYQRHILDLMEKYIVKIGFETHETDDHFTKLGKLDVLRWACEAGHSGCAQNSAQRVIKFMENPIENRVHPDNKNWIFCSAFQGFNETTAKQFADWAWEHSRDNLMSYLQCSKNHEIHKKTLNSLLMNGTVGEMMTMFRSLLESSDGNFDFAVDYYLEHHRIMNITNSEPGSYYPASQAVSDISSGVRTRAQIEKLMTVLRLDAVRDDPNISNVEIRAQAELRLRRLDASAAIFHKVWDKQLSTDNVISGKP